MAPLVDMHVQQVHGAGRSVSGLSGEASSAARSFLSAVADAEGAVVHNRVSSALGRYHSTWSVPANRLAHDVDALGQNTSGTAVDVGTGDNDATGVAHTACAPNNDLAGRLNGGWTIDTTGGGGPFQQGPLPLTGSEGQSRYASPESAAAGGDSPLA